MKKFLLIVLLALGSTSVYCQKLGPTVIASAGGFYSTGNNSLSWTIGECIPETLKNGSNQLTQGFQQGIYEINTLVDNSESPMNISVFPNPASDFINLEITAKDHKECFYQLFDSNGKSLIKDPISSEKLKINLLDYSSSSFLLNVFTKNQKVLKSFKILKIK